MYLLSGCLPDGRMSALGGRCLPRGFCLGVGRPAPSTVGYGQQSDGTHPTGIHSCSK